MSAHFATTLENIPLDTPVVLTLRGGATIAGLMNEWKWGSGVVRLTAMYYSSGMPRPQEWIEVLQSEIVAVQYTVQRP